MTFFQTAPVLSNLYQHVSYDVRGNRIDLIVTSEVWEQLKNFSAESGFEA